MIVAKLREVYANLVKYAAKMNTEVKSRDPACVGGGMKVSSSEE